MYKPVCIAIALLLSSQPASAEIFRCVGPDGTTKYQNFPCEIDSIGSSATRPPPAPEVSPATPSARVPAAAKPSGVQVATSTPASATRGPPRIGMTMAEVSASSWGEPVGGEETELAEGIIYIWTWDAQRSVQFDHKKRVTIVKQ